MAGQRTDPSEEGTMYKSILVATDGSKLSSKAVTHAIALAKATGGKLSAFYASAPYPMPIVGEGVVYEPMSRKDYADATARDARKVLDPIAKKAAAAGVTCASLHATAELPWRGILEAARKAKADVVVMASHGRRGVSAVLLGSETQKVLTHSKVPVIVVR
jgi:nucleotide-binding universal stress UspA family protein